MIIDLALDLVLFISHFVNENIANDFIDRDKPKLESHRQFGALFGFISYHIF